MRDLELGMPVCVRDDGVMRGVSGEPSRVHARLIAGASDGGGEGDALAPRIMVWVEVMLPVMPFPRLCTCVCTWPFPSAHQRPYASVAGQRV